MPSFNVSNKMTRNRKWGERLYRTIWRLTGIYFLIQSLQGRIIKHGSHLRLCLIINFFHGVPSRARRQFVKQFGPLHD